MRKPAGVIDSHGDKVTLHVDHLSTNPVPFGDAHQQLAAHRYAGMGYCGAQRALIQRARELALVSGRIGAPAESA